MWTLVDVALDGFADGILVNGWGVRDVRTLNGH